MANDMQYFIIAPPIIWLVWRNKKLGLVVIGSLIALSCVIPTVVTYKNGYAPLPTVFENRLKSRIQHFKRSKLRLHFEWKKVY